jgi:hypothetical protein
MASEMQEKSVTMVIRIQMMAAARNARLKLYLAGCALEEVKQLQIRAAGVVMAWRLPLKNVMMGTRQKEMAVAHIAQWSLVGPAPLDAHQSVVMARESGQRHATMATRQQEMAAAAAVKLSNSLSALVVTLQTRTFALRKQIVAMVRLTQVKNVMMATQWMEMAAPQTARLKAAMDGPVSRVSATNVVMVFVRGTKHVMMATDWLGTDAMNFAQSSRPMNVCRVSLIHAQLHVEMANLKTTKTRCVMMETQWMEMAAPLFVKVNKASVAVAELHRLLTRALPTVVMASGKVMKLVMMVTLHQAMVATTVALWRMDGLVLSRALAHQMSVRNQLQPQSL